MSSERMVLDEHDGIATLTLNRPQALNALDLGLVSDMSHALDALRDRGRTRVLLLTGAGRAFCSGGDVGGEFTAGATDAGAWLESHYNPLVERLHALPFPLVVAVNGLAAGAGCSLALAGDFVLAARSAYFVLAFAHMGLVPDCGITWLLPRIVGHARATSMMMLGERIPAAQAEDWGLIHQAVDDEGLMPAAQALAARLAQGPTLSYALIRQGLRACASATLGEALAVERTNQRIAGDSEDFAEAIRAFRAKRRPEFRGR